MVTYTYYLTSFPNGKSSSDRLTNEIRQSDIIIALDHIDTDSISVHFFFKDSLSNTDKTLLDHIVSIHSGEPLPLEIPVVKAEILTEQTEYVVNGDTLHGYYAAESLILDVEYNVTEKILDVHWDFDISLKSATILVSDKMINDEMIVEVSPNTLIGALIQQLNSGDTTVYGSPTVIENIKVGFYIGLYGTGGTCTEIGRVTQIGTNYVKIDKPTSISAEPGTYLAMCARVIPYLYFNYMGDISIGKSIPTGVRISKGTILRIKYYNNNNNNNNDKKVSFFIEYLY